MARHLIKRKKAGHWYAIRRYQGYDSEGQPKLCEKWYPLQNNKGGTLTGDTPIRTVEQALRTLAIRLEIAGSPRKQAALKVETACEQFLRTKQHGVRATTHRSYTLWLQRFCISYGHVLLDGLTSIHVEGYKSQLIKDGLKEATVNIALRSLRTFFNWAVNHELLVRSPMHHTDFVRIPSVTVQPCITWKEFREDFLPRVTDPRHAAAFGLAIFAGLRREELCHLKWEHIDFESETIHVLSADGFETKSGRARQVPLYQPLYDLLNAVPRKLPYVIGVSKAPPDGSAISHRWLKLQRVVNDARPKDKLYPHLRLHDLRGSFCTELLKRMAPAIVQQIMGHADVQTTMRYYSHLNATLAVNAARNIEFT